MMASPTVCSKVLVIQHEVPVVRSEVPVVHDEVPVVRRDILVARTRLQVLHNDVEGNHTHNATGLIAPLTAQARLITCELALKGAVWARDGAPGEWV